MIKKCLLSLMLFLGTLTFTGCAEIVTDVYQNPINVDGGYEWITTKSPPSHIRILGVYSNTAENKEKIINAFTELSKNFKSTHSLNSYQQTIDMQSLLKSCDMDVRLGEYGSYRNAIEKEQLLTYCYDQRQFTKVTSYDGVNEEIVLYRNNDSSNGIIKAIYSLEDGSGRNKVSHDSLEISAKIYDKDKILVFTNIKYQLLNGVPREFFNISNIVLNVLNKQVLVNTQSQIKFNPFELIK